MRNIRPVEAGRRVHPRRLVYATLAALGGGMLIISVSNLSNGDYLSYYQCAAKVFLQGGNPYACESDNVLPLLYFTLPFAALAPPWDGLAWSLFIGLAAWAGILVLLDALALLNLRGAALAAALAFCPFTLFLLAFQQATALILLAEAVMLWLIGRRHYQAAALGLLLTMLKPHLAMVALPLLAPLPRRFVALAIGVSAAVLIGLSWPYAGDIVAAFARVGGGYNREQTIALRELTDYFSDVWWWNLIGYALLIPPFLYFVNQSYRLYQARTLDLVALAQALPACILWLPYNRAYDWVLAIPSYLILWKLYDQRWTPGMAANILLAWLALPLSIFTALQGSPVSVNPLPLILLIFTLESVARRYPDRAAALRVPIWVAQFRRSRAKDQRSAREPPLGLEHGSGTLLRFRQYILWNVLRMPHGAPVGIIGNEVPGRF